MGLLSQAWPVTEGRLGWVNVGTRQERSVTQEDTGGRERTLAWEPRDLDSGPSSVSLGSDTRLVSSLLWVSPTNTSELTPKAEHLYPICWTYFSKPHLMCKFLPPSVFKFPFCRYSYLVGLLGEFNDSTEKRWGHLPGSPQRGREREDDPQKD